MQNNLERFVYSTDPAMARIIQKQVRRCLMAHAKSLGRHSNTDWKYIVWMVGGECQCCGSREKKITKDHIIPISRGGSDAIDNIQPLCGKCNMAKNSNRVDFRSRLCIMATKRAKELSFGHKYKFLVTVGEYKPASSHKWEFAKGVAL